MSNIVVYGSLINPAEIAAKHLDLSQARCVMVNGFRRIFNQTPSWRPDEGIRSAVLNVESGTDSWLNGILLTGIDDALLADFDHRERGYDRILLADTSLQIAKADGGCGFLGKPTYIYVGKMGKQQADLLPNPDYLERCLAGARSWGEDFAADFWASTYLANGLPLSALQRDRVLEGGV